MFHAKVAKKFPHKIEFFLIIDVAGASACGGQALRQRPIGENYKVNKKNPSA
jgi:hypothetical protein